jgi:type I restriction enzyme, S subunit
MKVLERLLGDVAHIIAGQSPPSNCYNKNKEGIPFYQGKTDFGDKFPVERNWCTGDKNKEAFPNDILLSVRAPVGPVNICQKQSIIGRGLSAIRAKNDISFEYLYYYLKNNEHKIENLGTGSTFKAITQSQINKIVIPIPENFSDQIRIATVLTRAEKMIAKRKESIKALDEFLKSTFLEMFGVIIARKENFMSFNELKLDGKGTFSNGPFGSDLLTSELNSEKGVPVIYIRDIRNGNLKWKSNVFVTSQKANSLPNCNVIPGDLLMAKVGDPPGISAVCDKNMKTAIITQDVVRLRLNTDIANPLFINYFINSDIGKRLIKTITIKGTRSRFPLGDLKKLQLSIPPIELQNHFASIVEKVEGIKSRYESSLKELENLYGALSQRAFKGELDLRNVK